MVRVGLEIQVDDVSHTVYLYCATLRNLTFVLCVVLRHSLLPTHSGQESVLPEQSSCMPECSHDFCGVAVHEGRTCNERVYRATSHPSMVSQALNGCIHGRLSLNIYRSGAVPAPEAGNTLMATTTQHPPSAYLCECSIA